MSHPGLSTETIAPFDTRRIRTVLVDDQELVRAGLSFIISTEPGIDVVAEAANGELGVVAALSHRPDLVLMDIRMPVMDGITATARLRDADGPPVLVLTTFDDDDVLWGAVQAGAASFLLKDTPAHDLIHAIRVVAAGGSWLDPRVTPRLLEVLTLVSRGASNPEIATTLMLSERTIKGHVGSIFAKLVARDRAAAIVIAYEAGLVKPGLG